MDAAVAEEQFHLVRQRVGHRHVAAMLPERFGALVGLVVQHDEIAAALELELQLPVVFVDVGLVERGIREEAHQPRHGRLDEVDAGRFQRLHEAAGEADRDAVPVPEFPAHAGDEAQRPRIGERFAVEVGEQGRGGLVVADVVAAVDVAVAGAVLQRNAPLPARAARRRARVRRRAAPADAQGTASARLQGSHWHQSS